MSYKPDGYSSVSPYLIVDGAQASIDFLVRVLDAEPLRMFPGPDAKVGHGEVCVGDSVIMFADAVEGWPAIPAHVHVYVDDVDATWRRALEAGATPVQEPVQKDHDPDKRGGFRDAGGTTWWVSQQMEPDAR